jgi:hypothetical protein
LALLRIVDDGHAGRCSQKLAYFVRVIFCWSRYHARGSETPARAPWSCLGRVIPEDLWPGTIFLLAGIPHPPKA